MYDVAWGDNTSILLQTLVHTGPGFVLHLPQGTYHLDILGVVIDIYLEGREGREGGEG